MNYYDVLELSPNASKEEIKASYKRLVKKYHPDINPNSSDDKIKQINNAFDVLMKEDKPKLHVKSNPNTKPRWDTPKYSGPINDDIVYRLELTLEELLSGIECEISYKIEQGATQRLRIKIPSGLNYGDTVVYKHKGMFGNFNRPAGDLIVLIVEGNQKKSKFKAAKDNKLDVETNVEITKLDILIGNKKNIPTIQNSTITVKLPKDFDPSKKMRIQGKGIKKGNFVGDMIINFKVIDVEFTKEQLEALELLRNLL